VVNGPDATITRRCFEATLGECEASSPADDADKAPPTEAASCMGRPGQES